MKGQIQKTSRMELWQGVTGNDAYTGVRDREVIGRFPGVRLGDSVARSLACSV